MLTLRALTPGTMRRARPVSTLPGPTSMSVSAPSSTIRCTNSVQCTGDTSWRRSRSRMSAATRTGAASTLATTGTAASRIGVASSSRAKCSSGLLHERRMEGAAHPQRDDPACSSLLSPGGGRRHRRPVPLITT